MELFHLKTPYLDCPQCFFYNSRALSGTRISVSPSRSLKVLSR